MGQLTELSSLINTLWGSVELRSNKKDRHILLRAAQGQPDGTGHARANGPDRVLGKVG